MTTRSRFPLSISSEVVSFAGNSTWTVVAVNGSKLILVSFVEEVSLDLTYMA